MRIVYMGSPGYATAPLEKLIELDHKIVGVYTQPDRPAGRGKGMRESAVKKVARDFNLPIFQPTSFKNSENLKNFLSLKPDLVVIAAYGLILPKEALLIPRLGCLNIHPSLLPLHRGPSPVAFSILQGDTVTGVSLMILDEGTDSGPLIAQEEEHIRSDDTTETLTIRLFQKGSELLAKTLPDYWAGKTLQTPQIDSKATYARKLNKEDGRISWEDSAIEIWRQIKAYSTWPSSYTTWNGKTLKIIDAGPVNGDNRNEPGTVLVSNEPHHVEVQTGKGALKLTRVQLEGKNPVTVDEFVNGQPDFRTAVLTH